MRNKIFSLFLGLIFLLIIFGLFNLQIIHGRNFKALSQKNCIRLINQPGARGRILDRQGQVIIDSRLSYDLLILPDEDDRIDKVLHAIAEVVGVAYSELKDEFIKGYLAPSIPVTIARNIDIKKAIALEELKPNLTNIVIQPHPLRDYPYASLACHVIGYLNEIDRWRLTKLVDYGYKTKDIVGFGGIEEKYDYYLRQDEGALSVEVDHQGRFTRVVGFRPPKNGRDVQLTLDLRFQKIVEDSLGYRRGSVVIMNPFTGEIIAMASFPGFSPAAFLNQSSGYISKLFNNPEAPLLNRAISGVFPAGSIFKVVVSTAALETGKINLSTSFLCTGSTYVGRQEFSCWDKHGRQSLLPAIAHSCNTFFYKTGILLGAQNIHDYALKLGLSKPTGIDLPYESSGFVPSPLWRRLSQFRNWFDGDTANLAIGQGDLLVTPIQMARMMAVFANNGWLVSPYVVKSVAGQNIEHEQRRLGKISLKQTTINYIKQGLRQVVSDPSGTGNILLSLPLGLAGKTGTVQVSQGQPHGWFVGFFPFNSPKFVICVFLEHAGSGYMSCKLTKQILEMLKQEGLL